MSAQNTPASRERDYSHRDLVDKLGIKPGHALAFGGDAAGVVDNKICSVSDTTSAMRFVIRKVDRK